MADLSPNILSAVVDACQNGASEAAAAFTRALDCPVTMSVGPSGTAGERNLPEQLTGAGLVVVLNVGRAAALVLLPESSGLLPSWYSHPDATGKSKLTTLAQELGMVLLPEDLMPEDFSASHVPDLREAWQRGELAADAAAVALELVSDGGTPASIYLAWPATNPAAVLAAPVEPPKPAAPPKPPSASAPALSKKAAGPSRAASKPKLPPYSQSLLRIKVPVTVTLARKRQQLSRIMELGPGSILQFDKSCEEMLDLDVGGHRVAVGEAVKVGDKFGLRVSSIVMPEERFIPVRKGS